MLFQIGSQKAQEALDCRILIAIRTANGHAAIAHAKGNAAAVIDAKCLTHRLGDRRLSLRGDGADFLERDCHDTLHVTTKR